MHGSLCTHLTPHRGRARARSTRDCTESRPAVHTLQRPISEDLRAGGIAYKALIRSSMPAGHDLDNGDCRYCFWA